MATATSELKFTVEKCYSGIFFAFAFFKTETVNNIKTDLEFLTGIESRSMRLYYGGTLLLDERTLAYYNLKDNATLHLVVDEGASASNP
jgi:hypothetical protein